MNEDEDEDEEYIQFIKDSLKYCECDYDRPCNSVLCGGICEEKRYDFDELFDVSPRKKRVLCWIAYSG